MKKPAAATDIPCFTLPALTAMSHPGHTVSRFGSQLIARCDSPMETFRFPCRIDAIIISVCTSGECRIASNLREYTLTQGSVFICSPKNILQVHSAIDFRSDVLMVSPELLREVHINLKNMMPLFIEFGEHPCLALSDTDRQTLHCLIAQIEAEVHTQTETVFTPEVIIGLLSALIAKIGDILSHHKGQHTKPTKAGNKRTEAYFKEFMQLLGEHYKQERSVKFYAQRMCITPKHLTMLIKRLSDKSVSDWIEAYVTLEAKTLLKYSDMSVQEIAYYLNFPNQSFFGSYFKRSTGLSPSQYKQQ